MTLNATNDLVVNRNTPLAYSAAGYVIPVGDSGAVMFTDRKFRFRELLAGKTIVAHGMSLHHEVSYRAGIVTVTWRYAEQGSALNRSESYSLADFLKSQDLVLVD